MEQRKEKLIEENGFCASAAFAVNSQKACGILTALESRKAGGNNLVDRKNDNLGKNAVSIGEESALAPKRHSETQPVRTNSRTHCRGNYVPKNT